MLEVKHLSISFPEKERENKVVLDSSFTIEKGEILAIIGESGSGKSMTALSIIGLLPKDAKVSGEVLLEDRNLLGLSESERRDIRGKRISMIFQEPMTSLNPVMKIGKQLEEPLLLHTNLSKEERRQIVYQKLEQAGLKDAEKICSYYPHQLSGGMRQRAMIAMALVCQPELMIADEPTTALDVIVQEQILKVLKKINQEEKTSILFISHNLKVVKDFCDRILVMQDGEIVEEGTPEQIFHAPKHPYTQKLLDSIPKKVKRPEIYLHTPKVLEIEHLNVFYPDEKQGFLKRKKHQVLYDISFDIKEGEVVGLIGGSGCGKSTLSKAILGLLPWKEGEIKHYTDFPQMVFQDPYGSLNPAKKIGWILEEPLKIQKKFTKEERKQKVIMMLEKVGLEEKYRRRYPRELSGGQRQRVGIALSLILGSRFIIADEPVSALDVTVQAQILKLLLQLKEEFQLSYLFISHDMDVIAQMCDRVFQMKDGRLYAVESGENYGKL